MIKINSENDNIKVNVASAGNKSNVNLSYPQSYYDGLSKQWAISENIVNSEDYSSKHYAQESKKQTNLATEQATIATNKVNEVIDSGNEVLSKISAQETTSKNSVKSEGESQVASILSEGKEQVSKIQAEGNTQFANIQTEGQAQVDSVKNQGAVSVSSVNSAGELQVKAVKSEGTNQVSLAKAEVVKATEQANLAKQYASSVDKESINISKMYTTGSVSVDPQGYNQLLKMKQNTTVTGIDVAKADDYEVVGNPVITDDGIASGFSTSTYLKINKAFTFNSDFEIEVGIVSQISENSKAQSIISNINSSDSYAKFDMFVAPNGTDIQLQFRNQDGTVKYSPLASNALTVGQNSIINVNYKSDLLTVKVNNVKVLTESIDLSDWSADYDTWNIGYSLWRYIRPFTGSIDLNSFKIYVDGNLVYQPCLKIPYTLSKTGSKIVDVAYRDRVQDLYEQTGVAPYYTIDETNQNFTLPMGEIYGMIERKAKQNNLAIGQPIIRIDDTLYSNEVRFEGAVVSKTTYADLYKICGDKYTRNAEGIDTDTQFCLPDFRNRAIWGSNNFGYLSAGLPNITGTAGVILGRDQNGAFYSDKDQALNTGTGGWVSGMVHFNAARSSSIYGGSDTVQPPAIKVRVVAKFKEEDYPTLVEGGTNNN